MGDKKCSKCGFIGDSTLFRERRNECLVCRREYLKLYHRQYRQTPKWKEYQKLHEEKYCMVRYERYVNQIKLK